MDVWLSAAPPEEIDLGSARLRRWRVDDAPVLTRLVADNVPHLRPWMPWAQEPPPLESERAVLLGMQRHWEARLDFGYALTLPAGEPIGGVGLHTRQGRGILEIGYWIAAAHTGRGHVTNAARALTTAAFALPEVKRVEIRCDVANEASAAVPRRLGFTLERIIERQRTAPGEAGRGMIWAVQRGKWRG